MKNSIFIWAVKITAFIILLQTLYFKFTGAEESIFIFTSLGVEPYGRIGSGIIELIASILIIIPKTTLIGAFIGLGTMLGAILSHLFILGIEVKNDGGVLFILALITLSCCVVIIYSNRSQAKEYLNYKVFLKNKFK